MKYALLLLPLLVGCQILEDARRAESNRRAEKQMAQGFYGWHVPPPNPFDEIRQAREDELNRKLIEALDNGQFNPTLQNNQTSD